VGLPLRGVRHALQSSIFDGVGPWESTKDKPQAVDLLRKGDDRFAE